MWWFCNCASIAKACTSVDDPVNKNYTVTSSWLKTELQTYASLCTILDRILVFCPTALFIKRFSTYLSKKCWNKEKRKSYKSQLTGALPRSDLQTKTASYLRSNTSAETDISITGYYKHSCLTTASHLWGFKRKRWHMYRQCHLCFVFLPRLSLIIVFMSLQG